jgi:transcriptional regulator with XRE-family HTH domain
MHKTLKSFLNELVGSTPGEEIARSIGKTAGYVSQIRSGKQIPTEETLAAIARRFKATDRLDELLLLAMSARVRAQKFKDDKDGELKKSVLKTLEAMGSAVAPGDKLVPITTGRTLNDFPEAFYPLALVCGDKREERESNISLADIGAYTATPADTRWIMNLGLRPDVVKHIDKNFLLLSDDQLIDQFGKVNLLVCGSPAGNHLARIINRSAVFRFNYSKDTEQDIEDVITKARNLSRPELVAYRERERNDLVKRMRSLFTGGIFDPMHPDDYVSAAYSQLPSFTQFDFGVLTFASNPYYEMKCRIEHRECDHKYVSIMAAGIHHPATAHALRLLGQDERDNGIFIKHPYGGVIRVELDLGTPFATRTMNAYCQWEDLADKERKEPEDQKEELVRELKVIETKVARGELKNLALVKGQAAASQELIEKL